MWLGKNKLRCSRIEPPGCFNTGTAPTVVHLDYSGLHIENMYLVGCEIDVRDYNTRIRAYNILCDGGHIVRDTFTKKRAYVYKTMVPARRRYERLCTEAREAITEEMQEIRALQAKAKGGDLGAALTLSLDY